MSLRFPTVDRFRRAVTDALGGDDGPSSPASGRAGSVLVLLAGGTGEDPGDVELVLTRRRHDLRSHPGQLSFPGGRREPGDHDLVVTALREAQEEIGLRVDSVTVLGRAPTFYIPPSRFWVTPVVAWWDEPHHLVANPDEVDEIIRVPLSSLLARPNRRAVPWSAGGASWAWQLGDDLLWGATAIVVAQLLDEVLGDWTDGRRPEDLPDDLRVRPWEDAPAWTPRTRLAGLPAVMATTLEPVGRDGVAAVLAALTTVQRSAVVAAAVDAVVAVVAELLGELVGTAVTVLVGPAGTGTVGLGVARRLRARGVDVTVRLAAPREDVGDLPRHAVVAPPADDELVAIDRRERLAASGSVPEMDRPAGELIVDALLGPGADPPLRGGPAALTAWAARHDLPVVAVALPSGVGADQGLVGPSLHADVTVALGMPTAGLYERIVAPYAGEIVVADVGIPAEVWAYAGIEVPADLFAGGALVRLDREEVASDAGTPDQGPGPT